MADWFSSTEYEIATRVSSVFENLGWEVEREKAVEYKGVHFRFDMVLNYNGKSYGYVEVVNRDNLVDKSKTIFEVLGTFLQETKPLIFVFTNGSAFEVYHLGKCYGTLTVPPSPEDVNFLFGGEE